MADPQESSVHTSLPEVSDMVFAGADGLKPHLQVDDVTWHHLGLDQNPLLQQILLLANTARQEELDPDEAVKIAAVFVVEAFDKQFLRSRTTQELKELFANAGLDEELLAPAPQSPPPAEAA